MKKLLCFLFLIPFVALGAGEIISPNMSMPIPSVGVTKGPIYATDINNSLLIIDKHDHSPGYGVPITPNGLNINSDLSIANNNLTNARTTRFSSRLVPITSVSPDIAELYSVLGDLYYNDASGHQIQITASGSVAGASGTITGLPSGTASASYQSTGGTFQFQQATSTAANMDIATLILRYPGSYPTPSGNYIALEAPSSLSTGYALTYPATLPGTTGSWLTSDTSGVQSWTKVDNSTLQYSSNLLSVKISGLSGITGSQLSASAAIVGTQLSNNTITATQIANNTITRTQEAAVGQQVSASCGNFSTTSSSSVAVTNLSVTLTTSGRPVMVMMISDGSSATSLLQANNSSAGGTISQIQIFRGGSILSNPVFYSQDAGASTTASWPVSSVLYLDVVAAGTYTYSISAVNSLGDNFVVRNAKLVAYEL